MKVWLFTLLLLFSLPGNATTTVASEESKDSRDLIFEKVLKENEDSIVFGPANVTLGEVGLITIKYGQAFIPPNVAQKALIAIGEDGKKVEGILGLVLPGLPGDVAPTDAWGFVALFFKELGFVRDADAKSWNTGKMLEALRENTKLRNEERRKQGAAEYDLVGWIEEPRYDETNHRLLWAVSMQEKGKPESATALFNAIALGRKGLIAFTFDTESSKLEARRHIATDMLNSIKFQQGKRYEDFAEGTDLVAEIGLAALVGGVAAKKFGLFGVIAVLLAKWGKVAALAVSGLVVLLFRKKKAAKQVST